MYWIVYWQFYYKHMWLFYNEVVLLNQFLTNLPATGALPLSPNSALTDNEFENAAWRRADAAWWRVPFDWQEYLTEYGRATRITEHSRRVREEREFLEAI